MLTSRFLDTNNYCFITVSPGIFNYFTVVYQMLLKPDQMRIITSINLFLGADIFC